MCCTLLTVCMGSQAAQRQRGPARAHSHFQSKGPSVPGCRKRWRGLCPRPASRTSSELQKMCQRRRVPCERRAIVSSSASLISAGQTCVTSWADMYRTHYACVHHASVKAAKPSKAATIATRSAALSAACSRHTTSLLALPPRRAFKLALEPFCRRRCCSSLPPCCHHQRVCCAGAFLPWPLETNQSTTGWKSYHAGRYPSCCRALAQLNQCVCPAFNTSVLVSARGYKKRCLAFGRWVEEDSGWQAPLENVS
jgi:hypothetical protein